LARIMDNLSSMDRRKNMKAIKSKETEIEVRLRKELWSRGLRYRKNYRKVPGVPDIVFLKQKVAIFCDSEFWHGKDYDFTVERIGSNREYWLQKIARNMERDTKVNEILRLDGWMVLRFWGKDIRKDTVQVADRIENMLKKRGMGVG